MLIFIGFTLTALAFYVQYCINAQLEDRIKYLESQTKKLIDLDNYRIMKEREQRERDKGKFC